MRKVRVAYGLADNILHVLVSDEGEGFDPSAVPDPTRPEDLERPGGRCLLLILQYMSGVLVLVRAKDLHMWKPPGGDWLVARLPPLDKMAKPGEPAK